FYVTDALHPTPPPTASLASPMNGEAMTAQALNAKRYIDITFQSHDGNPIDTASIEDAGAEFKLTGTGLADIALDLNGSPITLASPSVGRNRPPAQALRRRRAQPSRAAASRST